MDLIGLSIRRPVLVTMATAFLLALGLLALRSLPVDLYPDVSYPVLVVRANLSGAAPEEMEQLITKRLEDVLSTIAGVKSLRSVSREGTSLVIMEFEGGTDVRFEEMQVRAKVANIRRSLPEDMDEPAVFRQDPDDTPVIELALTGERSASELTRLANDVVANRIRQVAGVGEVNLEGERQEEILVELKPELLETWKVDPRLVVQAIRAFNRNDPVGRLEGHERVWLLRSMAQVRSASELGDIAVARSEDGNAVFLRDVATITPGYAKLSRTSRASLEGVTGPAVVVNILKQSGQNTVNVSDRVQAAIQELAPELPADVRLTVMRDNADLIRSNVADVAESLVIGAILTVLVVLIFLRSPRSTVTTGLALPSSVITTFAIMAAAGFTINVMTLLALSLSIGLLVDDAIVVRENIFRHLTSGKGTAKEAAAAGAREVVLAVLATTLTIVAVFLPVGFMEGVSGQFFAQFALTVVFAVLVSTWDAMTMAPMLSAYFANIPDPSTEWAAFGGVGRRIGGWLNAFEHCFDRLENHYRRLLGWLVARPWAAGVAALAAVAVAVAGFSIVPKSFLPTQLGDTFSVNLSGPLALPTERVAETARIVEERIANLKSIESWSLRAGSGFSGNANISMTVKLKPDVATSQETLEAARLELRRDISGLPGYNVRISEPADPLSGGGGRFQPLAVNIAGPDITTIRELARQVRALMVEIPGVSDVAPIEDEGLPEVRLLSDPGLAASFGVTPEILGETLKIWVEGDTSNSLKLGDDQIPIRVQLQGGAQLAPGELMARNLHITHPQTRQDVAIPLGNVVTWKASAGPTVIVRENRERLMRVGGGLARGAALGDIVESLEERLAEIPLPSGYHMKVVGQSEQMNELLGNVAWAIALGSIFVYMILASLFESFTQPLTVMAAIPLAATGAVLALLSTGSALDLYAGIGMVLLAGIVAKNSILLVDFAMQRVRDGQEPKDAILDTAPRRLRPILMTSIAMIAGMIPVATGLGSGGAARAALGIATIGGVVSSTFLTLLIVPSLYIAVERASTRFRGKKPVLQ